MVKIMSILSIATMAAMTAGFVKTEIGGSMAQSAAARNGLRVVVGNLAVDSRSGERQTGTRKCVAKYNPDYRSQYLPFPQSQRGRHASGRQFYGQS